jgi:hypothetical protein
MTNTTAEPRYRVTTTGKRSHYVTDSRDGQFIGLAFSSKRAAQAKADEKNVAVR